MKGHKKYYTNNQKYTDFLATQSNVDFQKYADFVFKYAKKKDTFLDVGCGTGIVLKMVKAKGITPYGVEVSKTSVNACKKSKLNCEFYDGKKLPFKDNSFNIVGSYNVLEHTEEPAKYLDEKLRVLKKDGYLIISCPNFLSITNGFHSHTRGAVQKVKNTFSTLFKLTNTKVNFQHMQTIDREDFQPDDDACTVTNPLDILKWGRQNKLTLVHWSSQPIYKKGPTNYLDVLPFKLLLGACFIVFKNER